MKFVQIGICALVALGVSASAQIPVPLNSGGVSPQGLAAVQQDLVVAIKSMESALPIYKGDRVKSIRLASRALLMVDRGLYGAKAKVRPVTTARDHVAAESAKTRYTPNQIAASQTAMNEGLTALAAAEEDFQKSVNNNPGKKGVALLKLIDDSAAEAKTAIAIHGGNGVQA